MKRVILIHGWDGHPGDHWKKWLHLELEKRGINVTEPQIRGGAFPKLNEWLEDISKTTGNADQETCLMGHSLGCIALVRYLNTLPKDQKVAGCVFVAGFSSDLGIRDQAEAYINKFYEDGSEVAKAKEHANKIITIVSDNDSAVPLAKALEFQKQLTAELILEKGKGHFCEDDGVVELPSALDAVMKIFS
jgi:predicted alpha/beta hydrolase family esterase